MDAYRQDKVLKPAHKLKKPLIWLQWNIRGIRNIKIDKRIRWVKLERQNSSNQFRYLIGLEDWTVNYFARCEFEII